MGQSCMSKSRDMLLTLMSAAHVNTARVLNYYKAKKEGYEYKSAHINDNDFDYERDILLDEDADDLNAFDYEEQSDLIVINAPAHANKSRQEMIQEQKEKNAKNKHHNNTKRQNNNSITSSNSKKSDTKKQQKSEQVSQQQQAKEQTVLLDYGNNKNNYLQNDNEINFTIGWQQQISNNTPTTKHEESKPLKNPHDPQEEYDTINDVMNEIQQNLSNNKDTEENDDNTKYDEETLDNNDDNLLLQYAYTNNNPTDKQQDSANFNDDADTLMQDIDNMIKYEEDDDDEEAGILDRI